MIHQPALH